MLALYSPKDLDGGLIVSGSADHTIRSKQLQLTGSVGPPAQEDHEQNRGEPPRGRLPAQVRRRGEADELRRRARAEQRKLRALSLAQDKALKKQKQNKNVCAYCFHGNRIYTGYEDGLICCWRVDVRHGARLVSPHVAFSPGRRALQPAHRTHEPHQLHHVDGRRAHFLRVERLHGARVEHKGSLAGSQRRADCARASSSSQTQCRQCASRTATT